MAKFSNQADLWKWLRDKHPEWAVVLAARAAMRVIPAVSAHGLYGSFAEREVVLQVFRGVAASWAAVAIPEHRQKIPAHSAAVRIAELSMSDDDGPVHAAAHAAAAAAAYIAYTTSPSVQHPADSVDAALYAVRAVEAAAANRAGIWTAVSADATMIEDSGLLPAQLAARKLWPKGRPKWSEEEWHQLTLNLLEVEEDWQVWTDWYEARLLGDAIERGVELARVQIDERIWNQGVKVLNARISRLIESYEEDKIFQYATDTGSDPPIESIPTQVSEAFVFGGSDASPIGQIDPPGAGLNDTADQRQGHADIREKAGQLEAHCGQSNRLAVLKGHASKLFAAAGESLLDLRVRAFWSQLNSLRRRHEAELRARGQSDPDTPALPEDVAGVLQDLVETLNVFAAHEPKLTALDDLSRDPSERVANDRTVKAARSIADGATRAPQAVDAGAASALNDVAVEAVGDTPSAHRSKEFTTKSARNLVLEAIRRAYKGALGEAGFAWKGVREGAYRLGGAAGASYGAALFIRANEAAVRTLIDTLGGGPTLQRIVDLILKILP